MKIFLVLVVVATGCTGCFRRWVMTDKQIDAYYQNKPVKPSFFRITNDSVQLFCATTGSDTLPPVIMIHGAPGAWYGSRNLLDDSILQKHFHIIAVDRLGYNKSTFKGKKRPVTSITTQARAIQLAYSLNKSGKTGIVMGSSYGAPIAGKMAVLYPHAYHHLLMLAPAIDPGREKFWWFHKYLNSGIMVQLLPRYIRAATAEKFAHAEELALMVDDWQRISMPVTVVQGGSDHIIEPGNLEFAREQFRGKKATYYLLPDAGHLIRYSNPALVRNILISSLTDMKVVK